MDEEMVWEVDIDECEIAIYKKETTNNIYLYCYVDEVKVIFLKSDKKNYNEDKAKIFSCMLKEELENNKRKIYNTCVNDFIMKFVDKDIYEAITSKINFKIIYNESFINLYEIFTRCNLIVNKMPISEDKKYYNQFCLYKIMETLC